MNKIRNKKIRNKKIKEALKKFDKELPDNLALEKDVILPVMRFLDRKNLLNFMAVCKSWNGKYHYCCCI